MCGKKLTLVASQQTVSLVVLYGMRGRKIQTHSALSLARDPRSWKRSDDNRRLGAHFHSHRREFLPKSSEFQAIVERVQEPGLRERGLVDVEFYSFGQIPQSRSVAG